MALAQVGKYMPEGLRAMSNLMNMLIEAARACKVSVTKSPEWDSIGIKLDEQKYWVGVDLSEPEKLWFGTRTRIDREKVGELGAGELVKEETWVPGHLRWWRGAELDSEAVHFYARSKLSQMQWLEEFIRDCLIKARSIETADQPPPPDDSEDAG
jgi:hypothetical protein